MDVDERTRMSMEMPISSGFLDVLDALITAWLQVRVLPGPPKLIVVRSISWQPNAIELTN